MRNRVVAKPGNAPITKLDRAMWAAGVRESKQLAEMVDIDRIQLSMINTKKLMPTRELLGRICRMVQCKPTDIYTEWELELKDALDEQKPARAQKGAKRERGQRCCVEFCGADYNRAESVIKRYGLDITVHCLVRQAVAEYLDELEARDAPEAVLMFGGGK